MHYSEADKYCSDRGMNISEVTFINNEGKENFPKGLFDYPLVSYFFRSQKEGMILTWQTNKGRQNQHGICALRFRPPKCKPQITQ
ncbi:hypothetical protein LEP1GSC043_0707 [Leptospira weilii str. Ecochallenge]|uniref:C-type lectin domain-containing protein n=1 Tax=Leptospira weilii str. Ecochallenge TaxID=1049986 RepID=N1U5G8_9LEPT|nr:hypothetical protein LEP1GSC043_0707 [Leptospira weilii str. Ecochallenge]